jgi:hypothetical protein
MKVFKLFFCFLFIFFSFPTMALNLIPFGDVRLGDGQIPIDLNLFQPKAKTSIPGLKVEFVENSLQWIRDSSNLLIPRARLHISLPLRSSSPLFYYLEEVFAGSIDREEGHDAVEITLWVNLFKPASIFIKEGKNLLTEITIIRDESGFKNKKQNKLIDYSCAPYGLAFEGLRNQYISVGCRMETTGSRHNRKPRLVVTWSASDSTLLDGKLPPFRVVLLDSQPSTMEVINSRGQKSTVSIKAQLPNRVHRLKTAFGFGPYLFQAESGNLKRPEKLAPAWMLYGNYELLNTTSLRFFNASVSRGAFFNNGGVYLAYELANVFDGRLQLVPLLGFQLLSFDYGDQVPERHKVKYPQGFEAVYRHAFGFKNWTMVYGMFISNSDDEPYKNLWLRLGKKVFGEVNYIEWRAGSNKVKTYGLSIGLPLISLF